MNPPLFIYLFFNLFVSFTTSEAPTP
uniref:Uncharacterized protein n=1 Tax=Rhizophora mucronata TaxID=61149 RepID=A0A2P2J5D9_RHIMU